MSDQHKFMIAVQDIRANGPSTWTQVRDRLGLPTNVVKRAVSFAEDKRLLRRIAKKGGAFIYAAVQTADWPQHQG